MFYYRGILLSLSSPLNKMGTFQLKLMGIIALKFAVRLASRLRSQIGLESCENHRVQGEPSVSK